MADQKDTPRHGRDVYGKDDPARTNPYEFNKPRTQAEIVAQAYEIEDPTPTQEENDAAKLDAIFQPPGSGDPQSADKKKELEANRGGGYQTRASTPAPTPPMPAPPKAP